MSNYATIPATTLFSWPHLIQQIWWVCNSFFSDMNVGLVWDILIEFILLTDYFQVASNGSVSCIRAFNLTFSGSRILLSISAQGPNNNGNKLNPVSTIVQIDVLDVNEAPQFVAYSSPFIIGYPSRTYFDPSVRMPFITLQVLISVPLLSITRWVYYLKTKIGFWCWWRRKCPSHLHPRGRKERQLWYRYFYRLTLC